MIQKFTNSPKNSIIKNILLIALLFISTIAFAQSGSIDNTFNTFDDGTLGDGTGFNGAVYSTAIQADGKIIVGGDFTSFNSTKGTNSIARLNINGSRDQTFNVGTGFDNKVNSIAIQADGKIILGGDFTSFNGTNEINRIIRLNPNGTRDATFNIGAGFNSTVNSIAIQPDGKIIVGGNFTSFNGNNGINYLVRLNADGTRDVTFNIGIEFSVTNKVRAIAIQPDGKIIVGGQFESYNGIGGINNFVRLNSNGNIDTTFNTGKGFNGYVSLITIQADGKIIVSGNFNSFNGTTEINDIARLNQNGILDTTFNIGSGFNVLSGYDGLVYSIAIQADGKMVVGGSFYRFNGTTTGISNIVRLNTNGTRDTSFNIGSGFGNSVSSISIQPNGKMIVGGAFYNFNNTSGIGRIARLNADGTLDATFNAGSGFNSNVLTTSIQADGKIIVGGGFIKFNGTTGIRGIVRLNKDGTRDTSFNTGKGFSNNGFVYSTAIQTDGKIIVGGWFTSFNGTNEINHIIRLNTDGTRDKTFNIGTGFSDYVRSISIQADGKIIVGGNFNSFNGTNGINHIVRLNTDGTRDNTFNTGTGFNSYVNSISIQADGKIIVAGFFDSFNGTTRINGIVRLNTNGTLDVTFCAVASLQQTIQTTSIQADGKIIVGGSGTSRSGNGGANSLVRLNANGTKDTTFNIGTGFMYGSDVYSIAIQADGKIIVGGSFNGFNDILGINNIVRLNANGTLDATFNSGTGFNNSVGIEVSSISIQADGNIIVGGDFTSFNGKGKNRLVRLFSDCSPLSVQKVTVCNNYTWSATGTTYTSSGLYTGKVCGYTVTLNLTIGKPPVLTTNINGATITANEKGATYQWIDCNYANSPILGATSQSFTATANGSYAVVVTKNTCSGVSDCVNINKIGIPSITSQSEEVIIYPNPNNGAFTISAESEGVYNIQNSLGQIIQSVTLNAANNYSMNIENLSNGIYFVTGYNNNRITQQKVVVSK